MREDGVSGVTSNPSIFGKAIGDSTDYDEAIRAIAEKGIRSPMEVFYDLALADVAMAADVLRSAFEDTSGADGFVSFELEPRLAHDTGGSIEGARELFERIDRPNVMIKVPGTEEGVPAVEELTALAVNVNITLLFSVELYEKVTVAYIRGLERRLEGGQPVDRMASVALPSGRRGLRRPYARRSGYARPSVPPIPSEGRSGGAAGSRRVRIAQSRFDLPALASPTRALRLPGRNRTSWRVRKPRTRTSVRPNRFTRPS